MVEATAGPSPVLSLRGIYPPIPTPFDGAGDVAYDALAENIRRWNRYDLAGYVVLGSNGETVYLADDEKVRVLEAARQAIPSGKLLIAGTGCESLRQTLWLTERAVQAGADLALVITPHFYGTKMTPDSLDAYYRAVADASPIPVLLYNVPNYTHLDMDASTMAHIAAHPNVVGVKDSGGNITKIADTVRLAPLGFQVLAGSAGFLLATLAVGGVGGVVALANIAPQQCIDIWRLFEGRRWEEAAALQRQMVPVNTAVTARFGVAGLKAALDMLGYLGGPVRSPLLDLAAGERQTLRQVLTGGRLL
jgi:4-hydroxy-2-oxoglutarate aldolase